MEDNTEQTNSPADIQSESRSHDGGAFTVARAVKLARVVTLVVFVAFGLPYMADKGLSQSERSSDRRDGREASFDAQISSNAQQMLEEGRQIFRFDTFGDEVFILSDDGACAEDCGTGFSVTTSEGGGRQRPDPLKGKARRDV